MRPTPPTQAAAGTPTQVGDETGTSSPRAPTLELDPDEDFFDEEGAPEVGGDPRTLAPLCPNEVMASQIPDVNWTARYTACPKWGAVLKLIQDPAASWPVDVKYLRGRILYQERICIPLSMQRGWIRLHHSEMAHVGPKRLWDHMRPKFEWADPVDAKKFTWLVMGQCEICQACRPVWKRKIGIEPTLVPPDLMASVAIDIFQLPPTQWNEVTYDAIALCVDRLSGWMTAVPGQYRGMTASWVAQEMYHWHWREFGIQSIVTSDQGPHFTGTWWRTMCAEMGVRVSYSQAYHHQANGRAEVAGQQLINRLRSLNQETGENWMQLLPQVLDRLHDIKGESGFSPYELVFGRERPMQGLKFQEPNTCRDARLFCQEMQRRRERAAQILNDKHRTRERTSSVPERTFKPGDEVWYLRPPQTGDKLDSRWVGPAKLWHVTDNGVTPPKSNQGR